MAAGAASRPLPNPQRRPPSFAVHWRDLKSRPAAWLVIARNLVPVVGIFFFGWSRSLVIFNFWFDGLVALLAILTAVVPRAVRETRGKSDSVFKSAASAVVVWGVLVVFLGLPYWIVLIPLHDALLDPVMWQQIRGSQGLWVTFGSVAAVQLIGAFRRGYDDLPDRELKQALRWDTYLLILKAMAMFVIAANLPAFLFVPALALVSSYLEIWPAWALGMLWGDPSRLYEDSLGS
jgi:hypothetical protein